MRFYKKYGPLYEERMRKTIMRHLTFYGPFFVETRSLKCKKKLVGFIEKHNAATNLTHCMRSFYRNTLNLQKLWKKTSLMRTLRLAYIMMKFESELDYLLWYFKR